jgi:hypothetical protein
MKYQWLLNLSLFLLLCACGRELPKLDGIDAGKWKDDKKGCNGYRQSTEAKLLGQTEQLKGLAEMDIVRLLGKPDQNELYKRNQKFYSYYISPGIDCAYHDSINHRLVLRFNAMGYAQLVAIEK